MSEPSSRSVARRAGPIRSVAAGFSRIRVLNLREIRTHRLRVTTSLLVVVVASALLISVLGLYGSLTESVRQVNAAISGTAQVEVTAIADSGIDAQIAGDIRGDVPDAKSVVPLIRDSVVIGDRKMALLGSDFRVTALSGELQKAVSQEQSGSSGIDQADLEDGIVAGAGTGLRKGQEITLNGVPVRVISVIDGDQGAEHLGAQHRGAGQAFPARSTEFPGLLQPGETAQQDQAHQDDDDAQDPHQWILPPHQPRPDGTEGCTIEGKYRPEAQNEQGHPGQDTPPVPGLAGIGQPGDEPQIPRNQRKDAGREERDQARDRCQRQCQHQRTGRHA